MFARMGDTHAPFYAGVYCFRCADNYRARFMCRISPDNPLAARYNDKIKRLAEFSEAILQKREPMGKNRDILMQLAILDAARKSAEPPSQYSYRNKGRVTAKVRIVIL